MVGWRLLQSQSFSILCTFAILLDPESEYRINAWRKRASYMEAKGVKLLCSGYLDSCCMVELCCDILWNQVMPRARVKDQAEAGSRES